MKECHNESMTVAIDIWLLILQWDIDIWLLIFQWDKTKIQLILSLSNQF